MSARLDRFNDKHRNLTTEIETAQAQEWAIVGWLTLMRSRAGEFTAKFERYDFYADSEFPDWLWRGIEETWK